MDIERIIRRLLGRVAVLEATPPGSGGDMYKSTYDPNTDGVIALAQLDTSVTLGSGVKEVKCQSKYRVTQG